MLRKHGVTSLVVRRRRRREDGFEEEAWGHVKEGEDIEVMGSAFGLKD